MSISAIRDFFKTRSLWVVLVLVLVAEITIRLLLPSGKIPKGAYHSSEFRQQVAQYQAALPVDMLIIGSSVAAVNYPPVPLDDQLQASGKSGFSTFNAGIRGCNYACIATGVRTHYLEDYQPPVVLAVLSPADLNIDNTGVVARSSDFSADMQRGIISRTGRNVLSGISYLYGFKEEIRGWLTSGRWDFDPAIQGQRGYIDMGSEQRNRSTEVPRITADSDLTQALRGLVDELAQAGTTVILMPVEGHSLSRLLFTDEARGQLRELVDSMSEHPNVHELVVDTTVIPDENYIDTLHLDTDSAAANAQRLALSLLATGLLPEVP